MNLEFRDLFKTLEFRLFRDLFRPYMYLLLLGHLVSFHSNSRKFSRLASIFEQRIYFSSIFFVQLYFTYFFFKVKEKHTQYLPIFYSGVKVKRGRGKFHGKLNFLRKKHNIMGILSSQSMKNL